MSFRLLILFLGMAIASGVNLPLIAQDSTEAHIQKTCKVTKEEVNVYREFLRGQESSDRPAVLVAHTEQRNYDIDGQNLRLAAQGHGIPPEVRKDFTAKNNLDCTIEPFEGVSNLRFISKGEADSIVAHGWSEFHRRFGKHSQVVTVSRVGFNREKTIALLHVISAISHDGVAGELYLLERKNGVWAIKFYTQTVAI